MHTHPHMHTDVDACFGVSVTQQIKKKECEGIKKKERGSTERTAPGVSVDA
jgi:hypothetical protein